MYVIFSQPAIEAHVPVILEDGEVEWFNHTGLLCCLGEPGIQHSHLRT